MIVSAYYFIMIILSLLCSAIYLIKWNKHFDVYYSAIFMLIPFLNAGYFLVSVSKDTGEALTATKITYLGGCYLLLLILMSIFSLCKIKISRWATFIFTAASTIIYACVLTAGHTGLFYDKVGLVTDGGFTTVNKTYGPVHKYFYGLIILYFLISLIVIFYSYRFKKEASRKIIILLAITEVVSVFAFFFGRNLTQRIEWIPAAYLFDAFMYLFIIDRLPLYDIASSVSESLVEHGESGFISFDLKLNYLGANATAKTFMPEITDARVDKMPSDDEYYNSAKLWIEDFKKDGVSRELFYERDGKVYKVRTAYQIGRASCRERV